MRMSTLLMTAFGVFTIHTSGNALESTEAKNLPDVLSACKSDCNKAKTAAEAHECAEKKGRLNKSFRDSPCYKVNEDYEKAIANDNKQ